MATSMVAQAGAREVTEREPRPSFLGVMGGEWLKVSRMWSFWIMVGLMALVFLLFAVILITSGDTQTLLAQTPLLGLYVDMSATLFLLRVFWGMMMIILTARLIGMEYSGGTIRILFARGVGRLQLLFAKLSVLTLVAVVGGALLVAWATLCVSVMIALKLHNVDILKAANAEFWSNTRLYSASVLISLGVSILMATAVTTVTRSLAAGVGVSVLWFPVDNFSRLLLALGDRLTHWSFWTLVSGDSLGLNLNTMGNLLMSSQGHGVIVPFVPLTPVTGGHTLLVVGIYAAIFAVAMVVGAALPDVKE